MSNQPAIPDKFVNMPENYPQKLCVKDVKQRFLNLLGSFQEPSVPLDLRVTDQAELEGGIVRQRVEYAVGLGEIVPAFHLFRKGLSADAPSILSIHAHGGGTMFTLGKALHCEPHPNDPGQYSYHAAMAGFRVLAPDALCFGERSARWGYSQEFFDEICVQAELTARGQSLAWKSVWDNSRAIEALETLGAKAIGAVGWSGGSTQAYILAAVNPKVRAAACFFSFMTLRHQFYQYRLAHCLYHYIPGMVAAGIDWDQVVALAAPRKLFFGWGGRDEGSPRAMYQAFIDAIEERCRCEGLPASVFVHEEPAGEHVITQAMLDKALQFLRAHVSITA